MYLLEDALKRFYKKCKLTIYLDPGIACLIRYGVIENSLFDYKLSVDAMNCASRIKRLLIGFPYRFKQDK